jgi:ATP-dependent exoDNAse (exonuclease V) alpha subunit
VPLAEAARFSLYRPVKEMLAAGDRIRFTSTVEAYKSDRKYKNGDTHTVAGITPGGNIRLDDGQLIPADAGHFRPAFVETSFGAQGQTVDRVILGMSAASLPATNQEQMYVSASRAKDRLSLYTDDKEAVRAAIQRSSQKIAALDLRPAVSVKPRHRNLLTQFRDRLRRLSLLTRRRVEPAATPLPPNQPERQMHYGR